MRKRCFENSPTRRRHHVLAPAPADTKYRYCGKAACAYRHCRWACGTASVTFSRSIPSNARCCVRPSISVLPTLTLPTTTAPPGSAEREFWPSAAGGFAGYRDEADHLHQSGATTCGGPYGSGGSRKYLLASLDQSLKRMGVEYVDIFYSHRVDENTPMEETAAALAHAVQRRKSAVRRHFVLLHERTAVMAELCCASGRSRF